MECYQGAQAVQYNLICKSDSLLLAVPVEGFLAWQAVDPGLCQMLIQSLIRKLGSSARTASQMPIAPGIVNSRGFSSAIAGKTASTAGRRYRCA